ncbi:MAG: hypothetical protein JWN93_987 [Hyphomicrobiales bacterium]|nr:hypothetical protein [Hyphomicrobiales bacterium]
MNRRLLLRWTATLFGLAAIGLAGWFAFTQPRTLRVAVGPEGSQQMTFMRALARAMVETRQGFRLEITPTASSADAARALDAGDVQLALLRSDDSTSTEARSIVVVQKRHVIVAARADRGVGDVSQLAGHVIGVVRGESDDNRPLVERILAHYRVGQGAADLRDVPIQAAGAALASGEVDALVFVAWPGQRLRRIIADVVEREKVPVVIAGIPAAEALAFRYRDLEAATLPAGVLGGTPALPPQTLPTVAITYELVASSDMRDAVATDLTTALLEARTRLRRTEDNSFAVDTPSIETQRRYMPHAGVVAYVNDDTQTFLEEYSDHIWLTLFSLSILGSSVMGFLGWVGLRERPDSVGMTQHMAGLVDQLDAARTLAEVDEVEEAFDAVLKSLIRDYANGVIDSNDDFDPTPWIGLFGRLVDKRRAALGGV